MKKKVIAIDGPSGAGKSTVARRISEELGFAYLDTGALYRAAALNLVRLGLGEDASDEEISKALEKTRMEFVHCAVFLNGEDVSEEIRTSEAGHYASVFSARNPVRRYLLEIQRNAAAHEDLVAEGRDMTTVVFPDAYRKFYLDASVEERAKRRTRELASKGFAVDENRVRSDIIERDRRDSNRDIAPLKKADDAFYIDSSDFSIEEVCRIIIDIIDDKAAVKHDA
jgi:cytidylate kinase